jgi:Ca2+-binding EF-hand superfamily protein
MSSISGINNSMLSSILTQSMQSRTDPVQKFKELDTDGNGSLDKTELSAMAKELSSMTGKTLNVDDSITTYDADNDGLLSEDEIGVMLQQVLGPPPSAGSGVSPQQASQAYQANSGDDQLSALLKVLEQTTNSSSTSSSSDDTLSILLNMLAQSESSSSATQTRPDPEETFKKLDSDNSNGLKQDELDVWAEDFSKMTGQNVDTADAISTYDADRDGELSRTEMDTMMKALQEKSGGPPPPPPEMMTGTSSSTSDETNSAVDTTQTISSDNRVLLIRQLLEQYASRLSVSSNTNITSYI